MVNTDTWESLAHTHAHTQLEPFSFQHTEHGLLLPRWSTVQYCPGARLKGQSLCANWSLLLSDARLTVAVANSFRQGQYQQGAVSAAYPNYHTKCQ